jgi:hypothetical protein
MGAGYAASIAAASLGDGSTIQIMAQGKNKDADDGINHFAAIMWQRHCPSHHAQPKRANPDRHHITMANHTLTKCDSPQQNGDCQTDFVDMGIYQNTAGGRQQSHENRSCQTMRKAKPGEGNRPPVKLPAV